MIVTVILMLLMFLGGVQAQEAGANPADAEVTQPATGQLVAAWQRLAAPESDSKQPAAASDEMTVAPRAIPVPLFDQFVVLGDSFAQGARAGSVNESWQKHSWAALVARAFNARFEQPALKYPGNCAQMPSAKNVNWWRYYYPLAGGVRRDIKGRRIVLANLAVAGASAGDLMTRRGDQGLYRRVLGTDGAPALEQVLKQNPSMVCLWVGADDVARRALRAGASGSPDATTFAKELEVLSSRLDAHWSVQNVVVLGIPEATDFGIWAKVEDPYQLPGSLRLIWADEKTTDADEIFDPFEQAAFSAAVQQMNDTLRATAAAKGWIFIDVRGLYRECATRERTLVNARGEQGQLSIKGGLDGGWLSADGIHPSFAGNAVLANLIIDAVNSRYKTEILPVDEIEAAGFDEQVKLFSMPVRLEQWFERL